LKRINDENKKTKEVLERIDRGEYRQNIFPSPEKLEITPANGNEELALPAADWPTASQPG
jgi:hypothetical protein